MVIGQIATESDVHDAMDISIASIEGHRVLTADIRGVEVDFGLQNRPATVKVHPNPSSSDLYVTLSGSGTTGKVIVYDILGNILVEGESFRLSGGSNTWSHNVSGWHTGTYVVRVLQDDAVVKSLRFIKN